MDYIKVLQRFRSTFEKNGATEDKKCPWFKKSEKEEIVYLTDLYTTYNFWTSIYLDNELEVLKNYHVPHHIIDFYSNYEPQDIPMTNAGAYLLDLKSIKEENSGSAPGGILIKYGLLTIATTIGGMAVCLDLNNMLNDEPKVVIVDYDDCCDVEDVLSYSDVIEIEHIISDSFSEFIWKFSGDEYDDFEDTFME